MSDLWLGLPAWAQDALILLGLLAPAAAMAVAVLRGWRVWPMTVALLRRHPGANLLFVALVAASVGLGAALVAQERALRQGSARAADRFEVVIAAPGDQVAMLLATVYLQPTDAPLLGGAALARLQGDPRIALLAPIAFGDSVDGAPVVGSTADFVAHLSGPLTEGRVFETLDEAVVGALSPLAVGAHLTPTHGHGPAAAGGGAHDGVHIAVVGRMAPTGSPWDRAVVTPVESVWAAHGLATGHAPAEGDRIGPPFDPEHFPGAPAFVARAGTLAGAYALRQRHDGAEIMAFFPGAVLARLHGLLGDVRQAMSLMATLTQGLVAAGVLAGLAALARLFARRFALLRALGAPRRFVLAVVWSYAAALIGAGCVLGIAVGWAAAGALSAVVTARTDIAVAAGMGFRELHLVAAFFSLTSLLALAPAVAAYRRDVVGDLRQG